MEEAPHQQKKQPELCVTSCFVLFQLSSATGVADVKNSAWEKVAALILECFRSGVFFLLLESRNFCCRICQSSGVLVSTDGRFQDTSQAAVNFRQNLKHKSVLLRRRWCWVIGSDGAAKSHMNFSAIAEIDVCSGRALNTAVET